MGNRLFISLTCCTLEAASWQSQDYVWGALGLVASTMTLVVLAYDSAWMRALANRCSGLDLPESQAAADAHRSDIAT